MFVGYLFDVAVGDQTEQIDFAAQIVVLEFGSDAIFYVLFLQRQKWHIVVN